METEKTEIHGDRYRDTRRQEIRRIYGDRKYRDTWRQKIQRYIETENIEIHGDRKYRDT